MNEQQSSGVVLAKVGQGKGELAKIEVSFNTDWHGLTDLKQNGENLIYILHCVKPYLHVKLHHLLLHLCLPGNRPEHGVGGVPLIIQHPKKG